MKELNTQSLRSPLIPGEDSHLCPPTGGHPWAQPSCHLFCKLYWWEPSLRFWLSPQSWPRLEKENKQVWLSWKPKQDVHINTIRKKKILEIVSLCSPELVWRTWLASHLWQMSCLLLSAEFTGVRHHAQYKSLLIFIYLPKSEQGLL